jgi:hypothetical protein
LKPLYAGFPLCTAHCEDAKGGSLGAVEKSNSRSLPSAAEREFLRLPAGSTRIPVRSSARFVGRKKKSFGTLPVKPFLHRNGGIWSQRFRHDLYVEDDHSKSAASVGVGSREN